VESLPEGESQTVLPQRLLLDADDTPPEAK
jgi:hypothetical protein